MCTDTCIYSKPEQKKTLYKTLQTVKDLISFISSSSGKIQKQFTQNKLINKREKKHKQKTNSRKLLDETHRKPISSFRQTHHQTTIFSFLVFAFDSFSEIKVTSAVCVSICVRAQKCVLSPDTVQLCSRGASIVCARAPRMITNVGGQRERWKTKRRRKRKPIVYKYNG